MKAFILETSFERQYQRKIVIQNHPSIVEKGGMTYATRINCFFYRTAKDRLHYNVTNFRQFTYHREDEPETLYLANEIVEVENLDAFFELVGFNYKTKSWRRVGEVPKYWDGAKYIQGKPAVSRGRRQAQKAV